MDETSFVELRIGIHCGEMVTGLSGNLRPHYGCFGDSVCVAARYTVLNNNIIITINTFIVITGWRLQGKSTKFTLVQL